MLIALYPSTAAPGPPYRPQVTPVYLEAVCTDDPLTHVDTTLQTAQCGGCVPCLRGAFIETIVNAEITQKCANNVNRFYIIQYEYYNEWLR